jgi:AMMECR1 domain-containing protein
VTPLVAARRGPLQATERVAWERYLRGLLKWQVDLRAFPRFRGVAPPRAAAFVSVAAGGILRGSVGTEEGGAVDCVARAFLAATNDARFTPVAPHERAELSAQVSFVHHVEEIARGDVAERFESGVHGVAAVEPGATPVLILPDALAAAGIAAVRVHAALVHKNGGTAFSQYAKWFLFHATRAVARPYVKPRDDAPVDAAAAWLAGLIQRDGSVVYAVDGRTTEGTRIGAAHHARAAVAIAALARHEGFPDHVRRARRRLEADIAAALAGHAVPGWPERVDHVAGTLALACLAGVRVDEPLVHMAAREDVRASEWHAPQVVAALGARAPAELWEACKARLAVHPWAPWTAIAARAIGDRGTFERCAPPLVASVPAEAPHAGGVRWPGAAGGGEIALSAIVAEALAPSRAPESRRAVRAALAFVRGWQFCDATTPVTVDPRTAQGAFPGAPGDANLRVDVTGHALGALLSLS